MSVKRINQWLSAIGKLLRHYEGKVRLNRCPLCDVVTVFGCSSCPWKIIEGMQCEDFARKLYGEGADVVYCRGGLKKYKRWRVARLGQLRNWKKIFMVELTRRAEDGTA